MKIGKFPWYNRKFEKNFNFYIDNPFKTWWKVRKYFKRPKTKIKFFFGNNWNYPYVSSKWCGKIIDIYISDVQWKDKWNTPRHERNPIIYFSLFQKFGFCMVPYIEYYNEFGEKENGDTHYWEYILDYLYYHKSLAKGYSTWVRESKLYKERIWGNKEDGSEDTFKFINYIIPTVAMSLNERGITELKKELKCCT